MLCFIFLLYYGIRDNNYKVKIAGYFALGISSGIVTIIGIINVFSKPNRFDPFNEIVKKSLTKYFEKINPEYTTRGLFWDLYKNHYWLELKINRTKANAYRTKIKYDPDIPSESEEDVVKE